MPFWNRFTRHVTDRGEDLRVAVSGAGNVGSAIAARVLATPGMSLDLLVNRTPERAVAALRSSGMGPQEIAVADDARDAIAARERGRTVITAVADALWELDDLDVVVEATGAVAHGATTIIETLTRGRDVVSMSAEADALLGPTFHRRAQESGAVYTIADGDQPGVLLRLIDEVQGFGFGIVAALNCKRHLNLRQTPDDSGQFAARDSTSVLMATAFGDGSKMQVEQSVVANALGYGVTKTGMEGIRTNLTDVATDVHQALGDRAHHLVDYTLGGDFGAGVVVIGRLDDAVDPTSSTRLRFMKMGEGPLYAFFRPWHLVQWEVPRTIATVAMDRLPLAQPMGPPTTTVSAFAKRDLAPGDVIDGMGGFAVYGLIDAREHAADRPPIAVLEQTSMVRDVAIDDPITWDDVEVADTDLLARWHAQEAPS